jgi:two-component system response regulator HydG
VLVAEASQVQGGRVLVIDDDADLLELLDASLSARGYDVSTSGTAERGVDLLDDVHFDVVLVDVNLPGMSGIDFCARVAADWPNLPVIVMTAFTSMKAAVGALRAGAYDFLVKPLDVDALSVRLERVVGERRMAEEVKRLREVVGERGYEGLLGTSAPMQKVYDLLERAAQTDASVLITGESGTGKELAARALHSRSRRREGPFVPVNCSAIPEQLIESELFGHTKGAFTDARSDRTGLFVQANRGTLFLDEIGEVPSTMQPKLLRALEERRVRPVGANDEMGVDVRFVAATNRDLEEAVEQGRFRDDLFFRINVIHVQLPPLRSRGSDVLQLAQHFARLYSSQFDKEIEGISSPAGERLLAYDWPGNVRELRNCMERAVALTLHRELAVEDLPDRIRNHTRSQLVLAEQDPTELLPMGEVERRYILHVVQAVGGNKSEAANILGLDRKTLYRKLQRYGEPDA